MPVRKGRGHVYVCLGFQYRSFFSFFEMNMKLPTVWYLCFLFIFFFFFIAALICESNGLNLNVSGK
jgi:hypothetical protein